MALQNKPADALAESMKDIASRKIEIDGVSISYKTRGSGPPMLLLHGWIGNEDTFGFCSEDFAKFFTLYHMAWPGYGESAPLPGFTIDDFVEISRKFIEKLNLGKVTLVGNCLGGNVAMELLRKHPRLIERMVLIEVHAYFPWHFNLLRIPLLNRVLYNVLLRSTAGFNWLNTFLPLQVKNAKDETWQYTWEGFKRTSTSAALDFIKAMKVLSRIVPSKYLEIYRTDIPVIYVEGGHSFGPVYAFGDYAKVYFQNLTVVSVPESLHNPVVEKPHLFTERVLRAAGLIQ